MPGRPVHAPAPTTSPHAPATVQGSHSEMERRRSKEVIPKWSDFFLFLPIRLYAPIPPEPVVLLHVHNDHGEPIHGIAMPSVAHGWLEMSPSPLRVLRCPRGQKSASIVTVRPPTRAGEG